MLSDPVWIHRVPYEQFFNDVAIDFRFSPDVLFNENSHLGNVFKVDPGDVIFLPIAGRSVNELRRRYPSWPDELFHQVEGITEWEAAYVQSGRHGDVQNNGDDFIGIDVTVLQTIMDRCAKVKKGHRHSKLNLSTVASALDRSMTLAHATNRRREVGFLSQAVIETDYFNTFAEYGKGAGHDYGNYYGRGMHQLTHVETYRACSHALYKDDRLVNNPDLILNDIEVNVQATAWYWRDYKPFNTLADKEDINEIIHRLYGGTEANSKKAVRDSVHLRQSFYKTIKIVLNARSDGKL
jgi:predicted chitinase